jgi:hypothetical protein
MVMDYGRKSALICYSHCRFDGQVDVPSDERFVLAWMKSSWEDGMAFSLFVI